jgi:Flp pilus assembly pilin Flp
MPPAAREGPNRADARSEEHEDMDKEGGPRAELRAGFEGARVGLRREEGQTLLEYALIVGFIGMGTIALMMALGPAIGQAFEMVTKVIGDHMVL